MHPLIDVVFVRHLNRALGRPILRQLKLVRGNSIDVFGARVFALRYRDLKLALSLAHGVEYLRLFAGQGGVLVQYDVVFYNASARLFVDWRADRAVAVIAHIG